MILKLENTTTHQIYEYEVKDMNNGEKLYFRFDIDTSDLVDGEYILSLYDGKKLITTDLLKIGDYNADTLQYKRGENTYINVTLDNSVQGSKTVVIETIDTTITPDDGFNSMGKVDVNAQPLYDNAYHIGHTEGYNEGLEASYQVGYDDGYSVGNEEGYNNGYNNGNADGIEEGKANQKALLEPITIIENGTYSREDGYNSIEVNVPDTNGSYDEGYSDGYTNGDNDGYNRGYGDGIEEGTSNAGSIIAETARVLDITENGTYFSRYSEMPTPDVITGVYADGTEFYNYAELTNKVFDTKIPATPTTRLELWYKGDNTKAGDAFNLIIGAGKYDDFNCYQIRYDGGSNTKIKVELGYSSLSYTWDENVWHHILIAKEVEDASSMSLWIDEVKVGDFDGLSFNPQSTFYINGIEYDLGGVRRANGCFGMIKIDDQTFIPTADGYRNINTGELLEVAEEGVYIFTDNINIPEGNLIKTVNVNVQPKINVEKVGLKFGHSSFTTLPEWADFSNVTSMYYMFYNCNSLTSIPQIDTSKVNSMERMFSNCTNLTTIPQLDTSKVISMSYMFYGCNNLTSISFLDTSKVTSMTNMFYNCRNLTSIPQIDTSKVTNMSYMFYSCSNLLSIPLLDVSNVTNMGSYFRQGGGSSLTDVGGWKNLKIDWNDNYGLVLCPNLTYQSCINILNGLWDFRGNGDANTTRTLKVHSNFITTVGDEISIATEKGWNITA